MKKSKVIIAFSIATIALNAATVSLSIAWYANSAAVYVNAIDITFDTDKMLGLATSYDGEYKEVLNHTELKPITQFKPVTTAHRSLWMDKKNPEPLFYDDTLTDYENDIQPVTGGYFTQELYLKSDDDIYVTINPEKTFIIPNETYNESYAEELYDEFQKGTDENKKKMTRNVIAKKLNQLVRAMRFSILVPAEDDYSYEIIDPYKESETLLGGVLDNDTDNYYDHYPSLDDPDIQLERVYGEIIGDRNKIVYDDPASADSRYKNTRDEPSAFNAKHKAGVKTFNLEKTLENGVEIKKEEARSLNDYEKAVKPFHIALNAYEPKKIVVSMYIEGWDLDSVNYTMGATFDASFSLKIERERY